MKKYAINIYIIISIILLVCIMIFTTLSIVYNYNKYADVETQVTILQINLLDRHITIDNEYEILYEIKYTNGLSLQVWKQVDYNNYITLWEENRYDESAFIN